MAVFLTARAAEPIVDTLGWSMPIGIVVAAYCQGIATAQAERAMQFVALAFSDHPDYRPEWAL